jgi:hypothetical protein
VREARDDFREERQEFREKRRGDHGWNDDHRKDYDRRGSYNHRNGTHLGPVVSVCSRRVFDVRINRDIFTVQSSSALPNRLSRGDVVRISGRRTGNRHFTNAAVSITNNR